MSKDSSNSNCSLACCASWLSDAASGCAGRFSCSGAAWACRLRARHAASSEGRTDNGLKGANARKMKPPNTATKARKGLQ
ncbi:hypothetical protein D3C75_1049270 [compost metagenome]